MYYIIKIETQADGKVTKSIYEKETYDSAVGLFHTTIGNAMNNTNIKKCICEVLKDNGEKIELDCFDRAKGGEK